MEKNIEQGRRCPIGADGNAYGTCAGATDGPWIVGYQSALAGWYSSADGGVLRQLAELYGADDDGDVIIPPTLAEMRAHDLA